MADIAHTKTDQKLEEMEKRVSAIYSRAEEEIQKTQKYNTNIMEEQLWKFSILTSSPLSLACA